MDAQLPPINADLETTSEDSRAAVTTNDDGTYIRTAVQLKDGNSASIDIVDRDGRLVCRLNIYQFDDSFNVDVIPVTQRRLLRAVAWEKGHQVLEAYAPVDSLIAVIGSVPPVVMPRPGVNRVKA